MLLVYFVPIWFQAIKGVTALKSGIMNLPLILMVVIGSLGGGILVSILGYYVPFMIGKFSPTYFIISIDGLTIIYSWRCPLLYRCCSSDHISRPYRPRCMDKLSSDCRPRCWSLDVPSPSRRPTSSQTERSTYWPRRSDLCAITWWCPLHIHWSNHFFKQTRQWYRKRCAKFIIRDCFGGWSDRAEKCGQLSRLSECPGCI